MDTTFSDKIKMMVNLFKRHYYLIFSVVIFILVVLINIPLTIGGQAINSIINNLPIIGKALSVFDIISLFMITSSNVLDFNYLYKILPHIFSLIITVYVFLYTDKVNRFIDDDDLFEDKEKNIVKFLLAVIVYFVLAIIINVFFLNFILSIISMIEKSFEKLMKCLIH
ncbi:hypothetical protein [Clostridium saccharoperbutylacetonicum]|uniref:hypothetical protein n=1 Tax=Clostridium saccharoperbutylacetonicum TaxID=36745 RepID=UPI0039EB7AAC